MKCLLCGKSNETSVYAKPAKLCDDCSNKRRCKVCNILKTDFYKYKNGKLYSTCTECFNKKVKCEFCNKDFNKTHSSKHLKRCIIYLNNNQIDDNNHIDDNDQIDDDNENHNNQIDDNNNQIDTATLALHNNCSRTLIVGPSFCGKTHLLLNKLQSIRLDNPEQQIKIITRSPEQYSNFELEEVSVVEDLEDRTVQDFQNCCVVFDDMLDSNQKLIDPFFTRGRHNDLDVYYLSQSYFDLPKTTIRNNSNIIILFQQTLKDVEHIYRDIAGFDMSHDEFKSLCREAWREKYNYLLMNKLEDKNDKKT